MNIEDMMMCVYTKKYEYENKYNINPNSIYLNDKLLNSLLYDANVFREEHNMGKLDKSDVRLLGLKVYIDNDIVDSDFYVTYTYKYEQVK